MDQCFPVVFYFFEGEPAWVPSAGVGPFHEDDGVVGVHGVILLCGVTLPNQPIQTVYQLDKFFLLGPPGHHTNQKLTERIQFSERHRTHQTISAG